MSEKTNTIEIIEETNEEKQEISLEGLDDKEVELVKKHGLAGEEKEEDTEDKEKEKEDVSSDEKADEEDIDTDPDSFEKMDDVFNKDEKTFHDKFTSNQKALYFKNKLNNKKRQNAEKELLLLKEELATLRENVGSNEKVEKIAKLLQENHDDLTIEQLQAIINEKKEVVSVDNKPSPEEFNKFISERVSSAEQIGLAQYKDFNDLTKLAGEVFQQKPIYQKQFDSMLIDKGVEETDIVEFVVDIAKLHKDYGKEQVSQEAKEKADRVLKNSKKKASSASVGGMGNRRVISYDNLTVQDLVRLPQKQFEKIPKEVRNRILKTL